MEFLLVDEKRLVIPPEALCLATFFRAADRWLHPVVDRRGVVWHRLYAVRPMESPGLAYGSLQSRRRVAQAAAGHASLARRMDMGILRRSLRRKPRPNLGCHARRAAAAEGRRAMDTLCGAQSVARQRHGQLGRRIGHLPAGAEAGMGAAVPALDHRARSPGQPRRRVAAPRRAVLASCPAAADRTRSRSAPTTRRSTSGSSTTSST